MEKITVILMPMSSGNNDGAMGCEKGEVGKVQSRLSPLAWKSRKEGAGLPLSTAPTRIPESN